MTPFFLRVSDPKQPRVVFISRDTEKLTVRLLEETQSAATVTSISDPLAHAAEFGSGVLLAPYRSIIQGAALGSSLAGRNFIEVHAACLDVTQVNNAASNRAYSRWLFAVSQDEKFSSPSNLMADVAASRLQPIRQARRYGLTPVLIAHTYFDGATPNEMSLLAFGPEVVSDVSFSDASTSEVADVEQSARPAFSLSGSGTVAANATATFALTATWGGSPLAKNFQVFVRASGGFVPLREIPVVNGSASLRFSALGLDVGENATLMVCTSHGSILAQKTITVTEAQ